MPENVRSMASTLEGFGLLERNVYSPFHGYDNKPPIMTIRVATSAVRRTLASTMVKPSASVRCTPVRAPLVASSRCSSSSSSRPDVPNPSKTDQGATGPSQKEVNAAGPSGRVPDAKLSDPYPLPFSPDIVDLNNADSGPETGPQSKWAGLNLASERQTVDDVDAPMRVPGRETEDRDIKIARLVYQCRKRGTLETDLLMSTFAKKELKNLPNEELDEFDRVSRLCLHTQSPTKLALLTRLGCSCRSLFSCWTSPTGTFSTGALSASLSLNDGTLRSTPRASSDGDSSSIPRTKKRRYDGCLSSDYSRTFGTMSI